MENLFDELKKLLKKDDRLVDKEGELIRNKIIELALKLDPNLIKQLLSNEKLRQQFFINIDKTVIFDKDKFLRFVNNKELLPDSYTSFKSRIGLTTDDEEFLKENREVVISFPFKDCVLEGEQTKENENRKEIFWNTTLATDEIDRLLDPKVLTNFKKINAKGEHSIDGINSNDNLIIKGNNLLVLHSLKKRFTNTVKLIYIDPPYNTGNDSFNYNDSFNHSTWLTFMKNRLEVCKHLLRDDGLIFVQIDYRELAYLKVLMDEIFDRDNFIGQINWQRVPEGRTLLGQGETDVNISTEYLLIYSKNKKPNLLNDIKKRVDATDKIIAQYAYVLRVNSKPIEVKRTKDTNGNDVIFYKIDDYKIEKLKDASLPNYIKNYANMVQSVGIQEESTFQQKLLLETHKIGTLAIAEYTPARGKSKGKKVRDYFIGSRKLLFAKEFSTLEGNVLYRVSDMNDFWSNSEIQVTDIANEGNVVLRRGKKPEQLLFRIINWATKEHDIVLDFFVGSGTTCAVAHKIGRQYIGIEQLDYGENDSVVRLKKVIGKEVSAGKISSIIEGYDESGISKDVNWKGGGEFIYCELMKLNQNYIEQVEKTKSKTELEKIYGEIERKAFINYKVNINEFKNGINIFKDLDIEDQKRFLLDEVLDKNQLYVNLSEINDKDYDVSKEDKHINKQFYEGVL